MFTICHVELCALRVFAHLVLAALQSKYHDSWSIKKETEAEQIRGLASSSTARRWRSQDPNPCQRLVFVLIWVLVEGVRVCVCVSVCLQCFNIKYYFLILLLFRFEKNQPGEDA